MLTPPQMFPDELLEPSRRFPNLIFEFPDCPPGPRFEFANLPAWQSCAFSNANRVLPLRQDGPWPGLIGNKVGAFQEVFVQGCGWLRVLGDPGSEGVGQREGLVSVRRALDVASGGCTPGAHPCERV